MCLCLCGDIYCPHCGPAQGNHQCEVCGRWSADGGCFLPVTCAKKAKKMADGIAFQFEYEHTYQNVIDRIIREE